VETDCTGDFSCEKTIEKTPEQTWLRDACPVAEVERNQSNLVAHF
jgi:hypothetical protein